jgi:hypothetical protein
MRNADNLGENFYFFPTKLVDLRIFCLIWRIFPHQLAI